MIATSYLLMFEFESLTRAPLTLLTVNYLTSSSAIVCNLENGDKNHKDYNWGTLVSVHRFIFASELNCLTHTRTTQAFSRPLKQQRI